MESLYQPRLARLNKISSLTTTEKLFEISFDDGKSLGHEPGQFVEVSVFGVGEAPISVSSSPTRSKGTFELVIRRVGNVTSALHNMKESAKIGIRGPFGTHFPYKELEGYDLLFVAGGIGLVPARSFINYAIDNSKKYGKITILFGSKSPSERLFTNEMGEWREKAGFYETVDRADETWKGNVGVITTLFSKISINVRKTACIIVGPPIMYKFVLMECKKKEMPDSNIFMSLERRMKCGVGKCGHCQMDGVYVCQKGPVFRYSDIKGLKEAL
jgi:sulfite reductase subunit B